MKTLIFDIDGTLTNMWPVERAVLVDLRAQPNILNTLYKTGLRDLYTIYCKAGGSTPSKKVFRTNYKTSLKKLISTNSLPKIESFQTVTFIKRNSQKYNFVYATGGTQLESECVLTTLGIIQYFDLENSTNQNNCRFSKKTGLPFKRIVKKYPDCLLITDSQLDINGAKKVNIKSILFDRNSKRSFLIY